MARLPAGAVPLSSREYRTLLALEALTHVDGATSVHRIAWAADVPVDSCRRHLRRLRAMGFVGLVPGGAFPFRSLVELVDVSDLLAGPRGDTP